ncbi:MAG TPA: pilus assembly protein PilM [Tepidisphaeraceae bacterium]|nr:pilus assembly protein PilM [Tepidisphaeraceae bacterium]
MISFFGRNSIRPIGLEIGRQSIRILQLDMTSTRAQVVAAAHCFLQKPFELSDARGIAELIRGLRGRAAFVGGKVHAALPASAVQFRTIRLQNVLSAQLETEARREVAGLLPFDLSDALLRVMPAGLAHEGGELCQEVIVAAVRREDSRSVLQLLDDAGLEAVSLQIRPLAAYRAVARLTGANQPVMLIDVSAEQTCVTIGRGPRISFVRMIDIGTHAIEQCIVRRLGVGQSEVGAIFHRVISAAEGRRDAVATAVFDATRGLLDELAGQIAMCLRYVAVSFRESMPSQATLIGAEARNPHLCASLSSHLSVPIASIDPFAGLETSAMDRLIGGERSSWSIALGLGLPDISPSLNQISQDRTLAA